METKEAKRILTKGQIVNSDKQETERDYYFICWFDQAVHMEEEFQQATKHCNTDHVLCDHQPDLVTSIVMGRGRWADKNKKDVECVHSYLLDHGWKEGEG